MSSHRYLKNDDPIITIAVIKHVEVIIVLSAMFPHGVHQAAHPHAPLYGFRLNETIHHNIGYVV